MYDGEEAAMGHYDGAEDDSHDSGADNNNHSQAVSGQQQSSRESPYDVPKPVMERGN